MTRPVSRLWMQHRDNTGCGEGLTARPPASGSLLWYRLACGLPNALPARSVRALSPQDAELARADYQMVLDALGPCGRTRTAR